MSQINTYLKAYKAEHPDVRISDKRILKIVEYESMKLHFEEELTYKEFCELASLKAIGDVEFKENHYRSKRKQPHICQMTSRVLRLKNISNGYINGLM